MKNKSKENQDVKFTKNQMSIISLWGDGNHPQEIAQKMGISVNTILVQLQRMRNKLRVHRTLEVYLYVKNFIQKN